VTVYKVHTFLPQHPKTVYYKRVKQPHPIMTAFTSDQQDAIEFYEENAAYVKAFGLANLGDREDRVLFKRGRQILTSAIEATVKAVKASERTWLPEEYDALAAAYVLHAGDRPAILREFRLFSDRHTDNAIDIAAQSCNFLDQSVKNATGLKDYAKGLLGALQAIDFNRFKGH